MIHFHTGLESFINPYDSFLSMCIMLPVKQGAFYFIQT